MFILLLVIDPVALQTDCRLREQCAKNASYVLIFLPHLLSAAVTGKCLHGSGGAQRLQMFALAFIPVRQPLRGGFTLPPQLGAIAAEAPDRSCTTALRTGRITPPVSSPYVQHMQPCIFAGNFPIREDYLLFTQTVQSNYCAKHYDAAAKDHSGSHLVSHPGISADFN